jgi:hypothetical protein
MRSTETEDKPPGDDTPLPDTSWANLARVLARFSAFLACLPTFLGWFLIGFQGPGQHSVTVYVVLFIAGWWGWAALFWLLVVLDRKTTRMPGWVAIGLAAGTATVIAMHWQGPWPPPSGSPVRTAVTWLLFGGMPVAIAAGGVALIALNRWSVKRP